MIAVVITEKEYSKGKPVFDAAEELAFFPCEKHEEAVAEAIRAHGAKHVIVGVERYTGALYEALPPGGVIARFGVGHDGIDKARATEAGLLCTNTPGVLTESVAEFTMGLIVAAARNIVYLAELCRTGGWETRLGKELAGKTLAVIGCGAIGCRVAQIASLGFRMNVIGCRRSEANAESLKRDFGFAELVCDLASAVQTAQFVSLHISGAPENRHFINAKRLARIPPQAWLINTSRGSILDEPALYRALSEKRLAGAALDVFEREPYQPADKNFDLRRLSNAILLPHHGSSTEEACLRMAQRCLDNIRFAEKGFRENLDLLNPDVPATLLPSPRACQEPDLP